MLDEREPQLGPAPEGSMAATQEGQSAEESRRSVESEERTVGETEPGDTPEEVEETEYHEFSETTAPTRDSPRFDPEELLRHVDRGFERLSQAFEDKLAYDQHKQRQHDLLHAELQEHKRGLLAKAIRPLLSSLVRLHDNFGRVAAELREHENGALTHLEAAEILEEFQDDVGIVLEDNGICLFREPTERFEPRRQTARQTLETLDSKLVGRIARRLRPGFERDEQVIQKERVAVYVEPLNDPRRKP